MLNCLSEFPFDVKLGKNSRSNRVKFFTFKTQWKILEAWPLNYYYLILTLLFKHWALRLLYGDIQMRPMHFACLNFLPMPNWAKILFASVFVFPIGCLVDQRTNSLFLPSMGKSGNAMAVGRRQISPTVALLEVNLTKFTIGTNYRCAFRTVDNKQRFAVRQQQG